MKGEHNGREAMARRTRLCSNWPSCPSLSETARQHPIGETGQSNGDKDVRPNLRDPLQDGHVSMLPGSSPAAYSEVVTSSQWGALGLQSFPTAIAGLLDSNFAEVFRLAKGCKVAVATALRVQHFPARQKVARWVGNGSHS